MNLTGGKKYLQLLKTVLKLLQAYKLDMIGAFFATPVELLLFYLIWSVISSQATLPYTFAQLMGYYALSVLVEKTVSAFFMAQEMEKDINRGDWSVRVCRPIDLTLYQFFETFAHLIYSFLISIPIYLIFITWLGIPIELNMFNFSAFLVTLLVAFTTSFFIYFMVGLTTVWTERIWGTLYGIGIASGTLSGFLIPIDLFPNSIRNIIAVLPFRSIVYNPILAFNGALGLNDFLLSLVWVIILGIMSQLVLKLGLKRFDAMGG